MDELRYQIDLLQAMNQKLDRECDMYRTLIESVRSAFLYYSFDTKTCRMLGDWGHYFATGVRQLQDINKLLHEMDDDSVREFQEIFYPEKQEFSDAFCVIKKKNADFWIDCRVSVYSDANNHPICKYVIFRDITEEKKKTCALEHLAHYDQRTGFYNRDYFMEELTGWIDKAKATENVVSFALLQVNELELITTDQGIEAGEEALKRFTAILKECVSEKEVMVSYFGVNFFGIAVYDPYGQNSIDAVYSQLRERLMQKKVRLECGEVALSASATLVEYPEAADSAEGLVWNAEVIMRHSKQKNFVGIRYYNAAVVNACHEHVELERKLNKALEEGLFSLRYIPQYSTVTRQIRALEVSLYHKGENGIDEPAFPLTERASQEGLMIKISRWVLREAFAKWADWKRNYRVDIIMAVKVPEVHFLDEDFVHEILDLMKEYEIDDEKIELEVREDVLFTNYESAVQKMHLLRKNGILVAIDFFGKGAFSTPLLKGAPIHAVRIDESLVHSVVDAQEEDVILDNLLDLINKLGYVTIAVGVDTNDQYDYLTDRNCSYVQGNLFAGELTAEKAIDMLQ